VVKGVVLEGKLLVGRRKAEDGKQMLGTGLSMLDSGCSCYTELCRAASDMLFEGKCGFADGLCACERIHKLLK